MAFRSGASHERTNLNEIAMALGGEIHNGHVLAPGPGHSANDRSLSIRLSDNVPNGFLVFSFAGDDPIACRDYVRARVGLPPFKPNGRGKTARTISYDYRDASGVVRYRKKRFHHDDGTKFCCFYQLDGTKGLGGATHLLYGGERLKDLGEGKPVWIVEGEKKVDRLRELGAVAVSGDTGHTSKWLPAHAESLRGLRVILWPDSDLHGEKYIAAAAEAIRAVEPGADIRAVRPFGPPDGGKGRDVCDWTGNEEHLAELAASALPYEALEAVDNGHDPPGETAPKIAAKPYVYRNPKTIPPRQWLHAGHYIRGFLSVTIAPGGGAKTSLQLVEAVGMPIGRDLLKGTTAKPLKVWYWNLEDPIEEIERRIGAILLHYKIDPANLAGQLFVNSDEPLVIAAKVKDATIIAEPLVDALTAEMLRLGIDVLIVDPFVSSHKVPENDNGAIDTVAKTWGDIARACKVAVEIAHHIRKPSSGSTSEITVDDARGAGSLKDAGRSMRVLNAMSKEEAEAVCIKPDVRRSDFRVDAG
jgi:AAA domain